GIGRRPGRKRSVGSCLHRRGPGPHDCRPPARRGHVAYAPTGGDGTIDRRPDPRPVAVWLTVAGCPARAVSKKSRSESDDRRDFAIWHPAFAAAHWDG